MITDRNIHMFWNTPNLPDWVLFSYNRYKELNPTWNVMLHIGFEEFLNDTEFEHYGLYKKMFDLQYKNNKSIARLSDIIRVYFIHKYGGIWVDCDTYPLRPFDELYGKNFRSQYIPKWFDLFTFGVFVNREQLCLDTIKHNLENFPVRNDNGPYYGFEYNYLLHRLKERNILFAHESQSLCEEFKKCIVGDNPEFNRLMSENEEFKNNNFSRHFEFENRNRKYTLLTNQFDEFMDKNNEKILVVSGATSNLEYQYSKTNIINQKYCQKWNYGFKFTNFDDIKNSENPPHFLKQQYLIDVIQDNKDKYDWVLWMDCDAWFNNFNIDIQDIIKKYGFDEISLIISKDNPNQGRSKNWLWGYINSGILLFRANEDSIRIIESWNDITEDANSFIQSNSCLNDQPRLCLKILFDDFVSKHTKVIRAEEMNQFTTYGCFDIKRDKDRLIYHSPGCSRQDSESQSRIDLFNKLTDEKILEISKT